MNIALFEKDEIGKPLSIKDERGEHLVKVLAVLKVVRLEKQLSQKLKTVSSVLILRLNQRENHFTHLL